MVLSVSNILSAVGTSLWANSGSARSDKPESDHQAWKHQALGGDEREGETSTSPGGLKAPGVGPTSNTGFNSSSMPPTHTTQAQGSAESRARNLGLGPFKFVLDTDLSLRDRTKTTKKEALSAERKDQQRATPSVEASESSTCRHETS